MPTPAPQPQLATTPWLRSLLAGLSSTCFMASAWASANTDAYRCTDGHGHVQYSQQPCGDGAQHLDKLADPRTAHQRREAQAQADRSQSLAHELAQERRKRERHAAQQSPGVLSPAQKPRPTKAKDPHAPVPIERCEPPNCYGGKGKRARQAAATSASPASGLN